jgi:hypothetical protein
MAALGDKIASSILAQAAGVPTLPWSGSGVSTVLHSAVEVTIPEQAYQSACVHSLEEALASCREIGYPAMLKVWLQWPCSHIEIAPAHVLFLLCPLLLMRLREMYPAPVHPSEDNFGSARHVCLAYLSSWLPGTVKQLCNL